MDQHLFTGSACHGTKPGSSRAGTLTCGLLRR